MNDPPKKSEFTGEPRGPKLPVAPDMEAFFVGIAMVHGTNPLPRYGAERVALSIEVAEVMANNRWEPGLLARIRRNYAELGGSLLNTDPTWFYTKLADAYLDWLYGQNALAGAEHPGEAARRSEIDAQHRRHLAKAPRWRF